MPICCYCGNESYIKYDNHFLCNKCYHKSVNSTFEQAIKNVSGGFYPNGTHNMN